MGKAKRFIKKHWQLLARCLLYIVTILGVGLVMFTFFEVLQVIQ